MADADARKDWPPVDAVGVQRLRRAMAGRWYGRGGPPPDVVARWAKAAARRARKGR